MEKAIVYSLAYTRYSCGPCYPISPVKDLAQLCPRLYGNEAIIHFYLNSQRPSPLSTKDTSRNNPPGTYYGPAWIFQFYLHFNQEHLWHLRINPSGNSTGHQPPSAIDRHCIHCTLAAKYNPSSYASHYATLRLGMGSVQDGQEHESELSGCFSSLQSWPTTLAASISPRFGSPLATLNATTPLGNSIAIFTDFTTNPEAFTV